jgi:hypothetical protein
MDIFAKKSGKLQKNKRPQPTPKRAPAALRQSF